MPHRDLQRRAETFARQARDAAVTALGDIERHLLLSCAGHWDEVVRHVDRAVRARQAAERARRSGG